MFFFSFLDLKTVSLSIEKLNKNNTNRYFHILHDTNAWKVNGRIKLGKCFIENLTFTNQLCLGKALFKNYLNKDDFVYMIKVYGTKAHDQLKIQDMFCDAVLVLPVNQEKVVQKEPKCTLWKGSWQQSQCKTLQVTSRTIQCQCKYLGYYSLEFNNVTLTTAKPLTSLPALTTTTAISKTNPTATTSKITTMSTVSTPTTTTAVTSTSTIPTKTTDKSSIHETEKTTTECAIINTTEIQSHSNSTMSNEIVKGEIQVVYYCVTGISVIGTGVFGYGIKRLLSKRAQTHDDIFPKYENIYNEELLEDFSETNPSLYL